MSYDSTFTGSVLAAAIFSVVDRVGTPAAADEAEVVIRALLSSGEGTPLRPRAVLALLKSRPASPFIDALQDELGGWLKESPPS